MSSLHYGRPEPPTFKRSGFELRDQTFTVSGYDRFDSQRIRGNLHPRPTACNPLGKKGLFRRVAEAPRNQVISHHFLTDGGEPDRTKTPEVLGLQGFYDKRELIARVVPGLHTAPCRLHIEFVENHDLCVGWDEAAVVRKAQDINREVEEERKREEDTKKKELDAQWQKEVQPYRQYMYRRPAMKIAPPPSFEQRHCVGSYIVRCDEITKKEECALRMTICPGVEGSLIADYNSGIIEGTMLLDASRKRLDELVVRLDEKQRRCRLQGAVW
ncbi:hypothetical protein BKA81DRAFT_398979 [Phyllosticta paracitricarpa]